MSKSAEVVLEWADGTFLFALKGKQIEELQSVTNSAFGVIVQRVFLGTWFFGDLKHTIRLALMGGGMGAVEATRKVEMYVGGAELCVPLDDGPNSPAQVAKAILGAVMFGLKDISPGEAEAGTTKD